MLFSLMIGIQGLVLRYERRWVCIRWTVVNDTQMTAQRMTNSGQAGWRNGDANVFSMVVSSLGRSRRAAMTRVAGITYWIPTPAYAPVTPTCDIPRVSTKLHSKIHDLVRKILSVGDF
jgi:hypothetical protein